MTLISVILPTRDRSDLLPRALSSILKQKEADFEVVVVDNNVTTPPLDQAGSAFLLDPRVRIVRCADAKNAAAARNAGLSVAKGEWVSYLDDDDEYAPMKLSLQLACAQASKSSLGLCGVEFCLNGRRRRSQCGKESFAGDELLNEARWSTSLIFHRNDPSVLFDEGLSAGEDAHFAQQLIARWNIRTVPVVSKPLVTLYQDGPARTRTNLQMQASWQAARRLWRQFGSRYSPKARRVFVLRALISREKIQRRPVRCLVASCRLLRVGGSSQLRFIANAMLVAVGVGRGRLVT